MTQFTGDVPETASLWLPRCKTTRKLAPGSFYRAYPYSHLNSQLQLVHPIHLLRSSSFKDRLASLMILLA